jgi:tRNA-Thr(GGU) m(6)t(6)A37 methyltransferase TsaA
MSAEKQFFIEPIAYIKNGYNEKFGIPRQGGLVNTVESRVVMCDKYNDEVMFRGLEQYSHLWLIWNFSENSGEWYPTVRPPKLGGNKRMGVFATRSPFRPNPIGLSCVRLVKIVMEGENAPYLIVEGADLMDGTPIYDIKPYIPYADSIPEASCGFAVPPQNKKNVVFNNNCDKGIPHTIKSELIQILEQDPHPAYKSNEKDYKMTYGSFHVEFQVSENEISVTEIKNTDD